MSTIAFDARKYFDYGIGTYISQLLRNFNTLESDHRFVLYTSTEDVHRIFAPKNWKTLPVNFRKYSVGEFLLFSRRAHADGVNLFHSPHYTLPLGLQIPSLVTIHDLIHLRFPQYFNALKRAYASAMLSHAARKSSGIIVDSEFTKIDILGTFHVPEKKINVIHLGVGAEFTPLRSERQGREFRDRFHLHTPFILFVGNVKPHKGLQTLLEAFALLTQKKLELVMVGGRLDQDKSLIGLSKALGIHSRIRELGRLPTKDLVLAYGSAEFLVIPSLYEGFGLPAIEAMACGLPVISSDGGSLPEIVSDAALVFHRRNTGELAEAMDELLRNSRLRKTLVAEGFRNIRRFSWREAAKKTLQVYNSVIS